MPPGKGFLNYTTTIPPSKSIVEIHSILVQHGALRIMSEYKDSKPSGLSFQIEGPPGLMSITLPARVEKVAVVLQRLIRARRITRRWPIANDAQQAERVAWRVLKDWTEVQMALLETEMVTMEEIFLPYVVTFNGQTVYEVMVGQKFLQAGSSQEFRE